MANKYLSSFLPLPNTPVFQYSSTPIPQPSLSPSCTSCGTSFTITNEDLVFYDKVSPVFSGKKYLIPPPTLCPDCRQQNRLALCNEFNLYTRNCDACQKNIVSSYSSDKKTSVYCRTCWRSDAWDPLLYGKDIDWNRSIIDQIHDLVWDIPKLHLEVDGELINSEYVHFAGSSKNSYILMHADYCEDCYYGYGFKNDKSCVDGFYNLHSELCYDCVDVHTGYDLIACQDCINCTSCRFSRDCIGCTDCFLCVGLREKQYCIENIQHTKEEYVKKMENIDLSSYTTYQHCRNQLTEMEKKHSWKYAQLKNTENSTGDHLINCKNTQYCFDCENGEDLAHCYQLVLGSKDCHDIYQYGTKLQLSFDSAIVGENSYHLLFCYQAFRSSSDALYCYYIDRCQNCFGCTQLRDKKYCILNKQYSQEEYESLVPKIIEKMNNDGEWGMFFPRRFSMFGYNETSAQMYYPLSETAAKQLGFQWTHPKNIPPSAEKSIPANRLPDRTNDIPDDILNWSIQCEATGKPFMLTKQELRYYRDHHLPVPHKGWYQRHLDRFHRRNPRTMYERACMKCGTAIQTTYAPDRPETVYCEECYLKEVY